MKRVLRRNRLKLRCHDETKIKGEKERKRGRQSEKYQAVFISNDKNRKVRMHENE